MKRFLVLTLLLAATFTTSFAIDFKGNGTLTEHKMKHKGVEYNYWVYRPQNLPADAPLVMVFHGYGSRKIPTLQYGFNLVADEQGFAVCYPCGPTDPEGKRYWSIGYKYHIINGLMRDDVGFAVKLVRHLQKEYGFSKKNVFAMGNSNGGGMCYMLAYKAPEVFSAFGAVSGHIMQYMYERLTPNAVPFIEIHGTKDPLARWNGDPHNNDLRGADVAIPCVISGLIAANRCTHEEREVLPQRRNKVIAHRYVGGKGGNQVWLYEIVDGKHSYAEKDLDAAVEIWKFFSMYLK